MIKEVWICKDCNLGFHRPMTDSKTGDWYCQYCGSRRIEKRLG